MQQPPFTWSGQSTAAPLDWNQLVQRLYQSEQQLQQLTEQVKRMQAQLDEVRSKPPIHVEYHFDQLKVNRLEGTLNVGITPQGAPAIESLELPDPTCVKLNKEAPDASELPLRKLQSEMAEYMDESAKEVLIAAESQYQYPLDDAHRRRILTDVKKQLDERVHYYAKITPYPSGGTNEELRKWHTTVKEKTTRDIQGAFGAYLNKMRVAAQGSKEKP